MTQRAKTVFTIGHSNHAIGTFLTLLGDHRIEALADVRRFPSSRYSPHFNQNMLARSLVEAGISYHHMVSLGGRREGKNAGLASYSNYTITEQFQIDLIHIEELSLTNRVAVMCAEGAPALCHRRFIADALETRGFTIIHILGSRQNREAERSPTLPGL